MHVHDSFHSDSWDKIREPEHIQQVLAEIGRNFPKYQTSFWKPPKQRKRSIQKAIEDFLNEQPRYEEFLDLESLEEYEEDPNAFKGDMKRDCPIIRRCINSRDEAMKQYKISFNGAKGVDLLRATVKIAEFGRDFMADFEDELHELCETVDDLELEELEEEGYFATGVIGEGIKSHLLYFLYPNAFPNRSQNAIWSLYFLTERKDFGLKDDSEFLMIDVNRCITQQNYFYPYDLFSFYALKVYLMLKESSEERGYHFDSSYRYTYLNMFFDHVAEVHQGCISLFKTNIRDTGYGYS